MRVYNPFKSPLQHPVLLWDLNLFLSVMLKPQFEPITDISLKGLSCKVVTSLRRVSELVALSCNQPFLVLLNDKVGICPRPFFLPKEVSVFHINKNIILPYALLISTQKKSLYIAWT